MGVVPASELLDPSPGVSGDLHHLSGGLALADEPKDLVVAALDRIAGLAVTVLQLF
jgi:hypothetical protein